MGKETRIGLLCDMHLSDNRKSPQYAFLCNAVEQMKKEHVDVVICLGDISSYGELQAWELYEEALQEFEHYEVVGNSDVRNIAAREKIMALAGTAEFTVGSRHVYGLNTPDGEITSEDRKRLDCVKNGDIIFLHHYIQAMKKESGQWLKELAERVSVTILHGHGHRHFDYYLHNSRVLGMRGMDPDKAMGDFPCINYLDVSETEVSLKEQVIGLPKEYLEDTARYFGLSCVENRKDVAFAIEHSIKYVELRCNGGDWKADLELLPILKQWRQKTDGYLSVHMPNLYYKNGCICGQEQWMEALEYANCIGAESLTLHPPRARICDMLPGSAVWNSMLKLYVTVANSIPRTTKMGIENLHKASEEKLDECRGFGYRPEEVSAWIDAINEELGEKRVGHVLDVGHARNNGTFAQRYPSSKWYQMMGDKAVAYHIHQVVPTEAGLKNHNAIENWFGPMINYTSFFYAWHENILNHAPVFLEVKGSENYAKSIMAFEQIMRQLK